MHRNNCELTLNAEVKASSWSGDVVGAATKRYSPHGIFLTWFALKVNVTEPMDHCDDSDNMR